MAVNPPHRVGIFIQCPALAVPILGYTLDRYFPAVWFSDAGAQKEVLERIIPEPRLHERVPVGAKQLQEAISGINPEKRHVLIRNIQKVVQFLSKRALL